MIADSQGIAWAKLKIESWAETGAGPRVRQRFCEMRGKKIGIENGRIDSGKFIDVAARRVDKERCLLVDRSAEIAIEKIGVVTRFRSEDEGITRIQDRVAVIEKELSVIFLAARLGKDLNASITKFVVLGREGVLVDANFANGRFW